MHRVQAWRLCMSPAPQGPLIKSGLASPAFKCPDWLSWSLVLNCWNGTISQRAHQIIGRRQLQCVPTASPIRWDETVCHSSGIWQVFVLRKLFKMGSIIKIARGFGKTCEPQRFVGYSTPVEIQSSWGCQDIPSKEKDTWRHFGPLSSKKEGCDSKASLASGSGLSKLPHLLNDVELS